MAQPPATDRSHILPQRHGFQLHIAQAPVTAPRKAQSFKRMPHSCASWTVKTAAPLFGPIQTLVLHQSPDENELATGAPWCLCELTIELSRQRLHQTIRVHNLGDTSLAVSASLHTQLITGSWGSVTVAGLEHCPFHELDQPSETTSPCSSVAEKLLTPHRHKGRTYENTFGPLLIASDAGDLLLRMQGFRKTTFSSARKETPASIDARHHHPTPSIGLTASTTSNPVLLAPQASWSASKAFLSLN